MTRDTPVSSVPRGPGAEPPLITVVVVNYNGGDYLRGCLASLARQTFRNFETILVDNNSTDGSLERLSERPPNLRVLRESVNHGFAGANNLAARLGAGRWLALLNPDAEADPDWLERLMQVVEERPRYRVVASLQVSLGDPAVLDGAGDCYLAFGYAWRGGFGMPAARIPPAGECFAPCGAAALYPREAFLAVGGFDEAYFCYHEDVDIGFRLRLAGERCQFDPRVRVRHAGSAITGRASSFAVFHGARNGLWTYLKNMPGPLLLLTLPGWLALTGAILLRGLVTGRFVPTLRGLGAGLAGVPQALGKRAATRRLRKASTGEIAARLTWNPLYLLGRRTDVRPFAEGKERAPVSDRRRGN